MDDAKMDRANHVTLFAQGMGHISKRFTVAANTEERISIPFSTDHISDVLASLKIFGDVKVTSPPSFAPENASSTSLRIDSNNAMTSLIKGLSGANVRVEMLNGTKAEGYLLGLDSHVRTKASGDCETIERVIVEIDGSLSYYPLDTVLRLDFLEESVKTEIEKARRANFQKIKPESTFLELSLVPLDVDGQSTTEDVIIQYTIPIAAWKMRYNIRMDTANAMLDASVIVDNNTDEDWTDTVISVVTGSPISFTTDLSKVTVPKRQHVNLVQNTGAPIVGSTPVNYSATLNKGAAVGASTYSSAGISFHDDGGNPPSAESRARFLNTAQSPGMDSKDVGDFCVFTSKTPVSIASKRSAIVDMFSMSLSKSEPLLFYKERYHKRRPFQAFRLKNESSYTLGRGKVVFYRDDLYQGEALLETTKPGETRVLAYCLESGVRVIPQFGDTNSRRMRMKFAEGLCYEDIKHTSVITYAIENLKSEAFKLLIEYDREFRSDSELKVTGGSVLKMESLEDCYRVLVSIEPSEKFDLRFEETWIEESYTELASRSGSFEWVDQRFGESSPLKDHPIAIQCAKRCEEIQEILRDIRAIDVRKQELTVRSDRIRSNYQSTMNDGNSQIHERWLVDLDNVETEIRKIDEVERVRLNDLLRRTQKQMHEDMKSLHAEWEDN